MHWARGIDELQRFSTPPYGCLYLPAETASLTYRIIRDLTPQQYNELLRRGWRRFGCEFFRPACAQCVQCRSLRLPLADFRLSRSQQRSLRRNAAIRVVVQKPTLTRAHLQLFNAYHEYMHTQRGWPLQTTNERTYVHSFLLGNWSFAREFLYYDQRASGWCGPGGCDARGSIEHLFLSRSRLAATRARSLFDFAPGRLCTAARAALPLFGLLGGAEYLHGL